MGLLDWLKRRAETSSGYSKVNVDFTEEENEAMNRNMATYAGFSEARGGPGGRLWLQPKVIDVIRAQGLAEYVDGLLYRLSSENLRQDEANRIKEIAVKSQTKAYGLHNLPIYLFRLAGIYEYVGEIDQSLHWLEIFLRVQDDFQPDAIDKMFMENMGLDMPAAIRAAQRKLLNG